MSDLAEFSDAARNALTEKDANRALIRRFLPMQPAPKWPQQRRRPERQLANRPERRYPAPPPALPRHAGCAAPEPLPEAQPAWVPPARKGSFADRLKRWRAKKVEAMA